MKTKTFTFTEEEARQIAIWANNAWHDLDQERMLARPDSPQERGIEADQAFVEGIKVKLAARESVTARSDT